MKVEKGSTLLMRTENVAYTHAKSFAVPYMKINPSILAHKFIVMCENAHEPFVNQVLKVLTASALSARRHSLLKESTESI